MAEKHYLFKKTTGEWVFGPTKDSVIPSGLLRMANVSETNIELRWVHNKDVAYRFGEIAYDNFLKENNAPYASLTEFTTATKEFFAGKTSAKVAAGSSITTTDQAIAVADAVVKAAIAALKAKQFAENGIHLLTGTAAAPAGAYAGFIPLADNCAISAITLVNALLVTGANTFAGVTLVQGMYYEIPGGFSTITLSAGNMMLVKA